MEYAVSIDAGQDVSSDPVAGDQDTFVGIEAPAGRYITQFAIWNGPREPGATGSFFSIDDLAFTTVVPEPSSPVLLLGSLMAGLTFTRRVR